MPNVHPTPTQHLPDGYPTGIRQVSDGYPAGIAPGHVPMPVRGTGRTLLPTGYLDPHPGARHERTHPTGDLSARVRGGLHVPGCAYPSPHLSKSPPADIRKKICQSLQQARLKGAWLGISHGGHGNIPWPGTPGTRVKIRCACLRSSEIIHRVLF